MGERYPVRQISDDELAAAYAVDEHAFHTPWPTEAEVTHVRPRLEFDRSLAAFHGATIVGTACAFSFQLTVPGAATAAAGVSYVAVLPSYRRRGILRSLMTTQLADVHARGEPIAVLFASEAGIYGRFGYGQASTHLAFTIRRGEGQLIRDGRAEPGLRLRLAEPERARAELAAIYDRVLPMRPGFFARDDRWWDANLYDPAYRRPGLTPLRCLLAHDAAGPRGYALYRAEPRWDEDALPDSVITVRELMADSPAATSALWADLMSRDLTGELRARLRPVDDPLLHLLTDPRCARTRCSDGLWVRLVDVGEALARRRYAAPVDLVFEVSDEICPWNGGRWRLRADGPAGLAGVTCERTADPADLALPVTALGAAYLGGTRLGGLAAAGLVSELRAGALTAASAAMSWDPAPWCPMVF
jgi:predicted acetyltransferase